MDLLSIKFTFVGLLFFLGVLGSFLPIMPGCFIVWLGIALDKFWLPEYSVTWGFFWTATGLTLLAQVLDIACAYWGTKRLGGTWRGGLGAVAGVVFFPLVLSPALGIGPIVGFIIGPIIGAILGELAGGRTFSEAGAASVGTLLGGITAFLIKFTIACVMIAGFFFFRD